MIGYVAQVINIVAATIQNSFVFASLVGELIISIGIWICKIIMTTGTHILKFSHIVYEDNICIFAEIPSSLADIVDTTINQFLYVYDGIQQVFQYLTKQVMDMVLSVSWLMNAIVVIVSEVLILLINTAIFIGETTWFMITFIPIHFPMLVKSGIKSVTDITVTSVVDAYMRLLVFTNFLSEVPLESFLGITSAIVIVRLCIHFKDVVVTNLFNLYWALVRNLTYMYYACCNYWTNPEVQVISRIVSGDMINNADEHYDDVPAEDANSTADALCVICQERQKCVLTLPCRHICLCTECCRRLYSYQRTCPVCRTFIYHSVTVYW